MDRYHHLGALFLLLLLLILLHPNRATKGRLGGFG